MFWSYKYTLENKIENYKLKNLQKNKIIYKMDKKS